jgi:hypothetical protein
MQCLMMLKVDMFRMLYWRLLALLWIVVIGQVSTAALAMPMDASASGNDMQQLLEKARNQGIVRVIVSLNMPFVPEGHLPNEAAVQSQRNAIANAQAAVLARLRGCTVESIQRYKYTPTLALGVDACGLIRLMKAHKVSHITEDALLPRAQPREHEED